VFVITFLNMHQWKMVAAVVISLRNRWAVALGHAVKYAM